MGLPAAILLAMRLASSLLRAATGFALIINVSQRLTVGVTHDETVGRDFGRPWRREAAGGHYLTMVLPS